MPIHRTRTLENLSASSALSFSSKGSTPAAGSDVVRRAPVQLATSPSTRSTEADTDGVQPVQRRPIAGAKERLAQRNGKVPLHTGLSVVLASTTLEPRAVQKEQAPSQPDKGDVAEKRVSREMKRKELRVNTKLPIPAGKGAGLEGEENEVEGLLLGQDRKTKCRWLLHGKSPKGVKRRRVDIYTPSPQIQEDSEVEGRKPASLLDEIEGHRQDIARQPQEAGHEIQERPCKFLRLHSQDGKAAVAPQLDATVTTEPLSVYPGVYALEKAQIAGVPRPKWTHIIHIENCKIQRDHKNFQDENDVHHLHLYTHPSSISPISLQDGHLRAGRDFLSLALPYSCSQAEDSHSFSEPPPSWVDQRWDFEPGRVLITFDCGRLPDVLALVASFGVFDGAGTAEEFMEHFMDAFPDSATADVARDIWEDWRAVEKLKRAGAVDMIKRPIRKAKQVWTAPVYVDEWE